MSTILKPLTRQLPADGRSSAQDRLTFYGDRRPKAPEHSLNGGSLALSRAYPKFKHVLDLIQKDRYERVSSLLEGWHVLFHGNYSCPAATQFEVVDTLRQGTRFRVWIVGRVN